MDTQNLGVVTILRSALKGEALTLPENFDWSKATHTLYSHNLAGLGLQGALLCGVPRNHPAVVNLTATFCNDLRTSRSQMQKLQAVFDLFDANGIDYLPVKGSQIKLLYPRPEYRIMFDADILIRQEQYPLIQSVLPAIGMQEAEDSDYEHTWESPELTLELHRYLVSTHFRSYFPYYRDSWRFAEKNETGSGYHLTPEDHFIYLVVHFAKHYANGTICAKDICDFYVWRNAYPQMNEEYLLGELEKLRLAEFYRNILALLDTWFEGKAATKAVELITHTAFQGGIFEAYNLSAANHVVHRHSNEGDTLTVKKAKWFFHALFPSRAILSYRYPILKRCAILLPFFWAVRWFHALFHDRDKFRRGMLVMGMNDNTLSQYGTHMNAVGLDSFRHR